MEHHVTAVLHEEFYTVLFCYCGGAVMFENANNKLRMMSNAWDGHLKEPHGLSIY